MSELPSLCRMRLTNHSLWRQTGEIHQKEAWEGTADSLWLREPRESHELHRHKCLQFADPPHPTPGQALNHSFLCVSLTPLYLNYSSYCCAGIICLWVCLSYQTMSNSTTYLSLYPNPVSGWRVQALESDCLQSDPCSVRVNRMTGAGYVI